MDARILEIVSDATVSICRAQTKDELVQAVGAGFNGLGFGSFSLSCHKANKHELALNPTLSTWPASFVAEYERRNWADWNPNLARAAAVDETFSWNIQERYGNAREQSYIDFLMNTPLQGGLSIPLAHKPGRLSSVSVESHNARHFSPAIVNAAIVLSNATQMKAEALGLCPEISTDESLHLRALSSPQAEILKWVSVGKSNIDIATITGLSERAVKYHLGEILRKLGVATRAQAAALHVNGRWTGRGERTFMPSAAAS